MTGGGGGGFCGGGDEGGGDGAGGADLNSVRKLKSVRMSVKCMKAKKR